jgi:hypothetical protein
MNKREEKSVSILVGKVEGHRCLKTQTLTGE